MKLTPAFGDTLPAREQPSQPHKEIWQIAATNNERAKVVTRRQAKHDRVFTGC